MKYEEFVYELIKMLIEYGAWTGCVKIVYGDKTYEPCEMSKRQYHKSKAFVDYFYRRDISRKLQEEKKNNTYRNLKNVVVSEIKEVDAEFKKRWPEKCEMYIQFNSELNSLFAEGILEVDLWDLPLAVKEEEYEMNPDIQDDFKSYFDEIDIKKNPDEYGFPSDLDFDSADEYQKLYDEEMEKAENEYIAALCGKKEYDNDLEAEICNLCIKSDLSYDFIGAGLFVGHDYF